MAKPSKSTKSSTKPIESLTPDQIDQIAKRVEIKIYKKIKHLLWILPTIFGLSVWGIYTKATEQLQNLLINRISEEFKQPTIRKTIEDVAANNAKQLFMNEIQPEVTKFKKDIHNEVEKQKKVIVELKEGQNNLVERINKIESKERNKLEKEFPKGYTVLGFPSEHAVIAVTEYIPEGVKVDWNKAKIAEHTKDKITIILPKVSFPINNVISGSVTIPKKVGAKARLVATPEWVLYAAVLSIEKDLIVIAVGFEQRN